MGENDRGSGIQIWNTENKRKSDMFLKVFAGLVAVVAIAIGFHAFPGDALKGDLEVLTSSEALDAHLSSFRDSIPSSDYAGYRGHLLRVLSYTLHFLKGSPDVKNFRRLIEIALVYHDVGLWTDKKLDYLQPSFDRFLEAHESEFSKEEKQLVHDIIIYHHKFTDFQGPHADIVNAVRKADWIDASMGLIRNGMSKDNVAKAFSKIPVNGFYDTLLNMGPRIHGNDVLSWFQVFKIFYF